MTNIGFIGLGTMGLPMARNLVKAGYAVAGIDLNKEALRAFEQAGGTAANAGGEAIQQADFVITMLPVGEAVKGVLFGEAGLAASIPTSALYIDMSTIAPEDTDEIGERLGEAGVAMVDAPVGRTSQHAADGKLLIMAGGETANFQRALPLFECMGDTIHHCGGLGTGSRMKIVNNYMSIVLNALTAEALTLAECAGLDVGLALDVMRGTTAGQGHMSTTYPAKVLNNDVSPGFMIDLADKDLKLALAFAEAIKAPVKVGSVSRGLYETARDRGRGRDDWTALYEVVRALTGLPDISN